MILPGSPKGDPRGDRFRRSHRGITQKDRSGGSAREIPHGDRQRDPLQDPLADHPGAPPEPQRDPPGGSIQNYRRDTSMGAILAKEIPRFCRLPKQIYAGDTWL